MLFISCKDERERQRECDTFSFLVFVSFILMGNTNHSLCYLTFSSQLYTISGGHDGRMQLKDVWASSDGGATWTQVCQNAQWEGRQGHACVLVDGYVYLMGGLSGATRFNDLWKSRDCGECDG